VKEHDKRKKKQSEEGDKLSSASSLLVLFSPSTLQVEATCFSETSAFLRTTAHTEAVFGTRSLKRHVAWRTAHEILWKERKSFVKLAAVPTLWLRSETKFRNMKYSRNWAQYRQSWEPVGTEGMKLNTSETSYKFIYKTEVASLYFVFIRAVICKN
jgi:hypothetical protein